MTILPFPGPRNAAQSVEKRIVTLETQLAHMAQVNLLLAADDIAALKALNYTETQIAALQSPDSLGAMGFSAWTFEQIESRIRELRRGVEVVPITSAPGWDGRA